MSVLTKLFLLSIFIGKVDRILSEEYYIDTEEKLSFFTSFFYKEQNKSIKLYHLCIEQRGIFVLVDTYLLRIYTDPKCKLYIVFKSIYFDDKLNYGVNFFGHRIFNALSMLDETQKLHKMKISKTNLNSHTDLGNKKLLTACFKRC